MATLASTILASVSRRARDASQTAHSASFILSLLDRVQGLVNVQQQSLQATIAYSNTQAKTLYSLTEDLPGLVVISNVRLGNQRLDEITPWQNLFKLSPTWLTDTASQPQGWSRLGQDLIAVWPAPSTNITLNFQGVAATAPLNNSGQDLELAFEDEDIIRELMVALLLLRQRDLDSVSAIIQRMANKLQLQLPEELQRGASGRSNARQ
jgi:hypothetical protein